MDEGEVAESLRCIAEHTAGTRIHLFGHQSQVVADGCKQCIHLSPRSVNVAKQCEGLNQPERAGEKGTLLAVHG